MTFLDPVPSRRDGGVIATGKIPGHPEFLPARTVHEPAQSFEAWIEAGMGLASYRYGAAWTQVFEPSRVLGFVWRAPAAARSEALLCGLLFPSVDSVGRHYPLTIACTLPMRFVLHAPHVLPLALGDFLERAHDATADFTRMSPDELLARIRGLAPPNEHDVARALDEYDSWCAATPIERAWSAVFDHAPVETSVAIIHALASATESVRGLEAPASGPTLRLPLGRGGPASATLWLDIVRRLSRWRATVPSTFWAVSEGSLLVTLGDAPPGALSALWYPHPGHEHILDLSPPSSPPSSTPPMSAYPMSSLPSSRGASQEGTLRVDEPMRELLDALSR